MIKLIASLCLIVGLCGAAMAQEPASQSRVLRPVDSTPVVVPPVPRPDLPQINGRESVADFNLPYICCGDCHEGDKDDPQIQLARDAYCRDDGRDYIVEIAPAGRQVRGPGVKPVMVDDIEVETVRDQARQPVLPH